MLEAMVESESLGRTIRIVMNDRVRQMLRCPACGDHVVDGGMSNKLQGGLEEFHCMRCGRVFPFIEGVPRMTVSPVEKGHIAQSFGFQWMARERGRFERDMLYGLTMDQERAAFFNAYGVTPTELKGKTFLDAGCGDGTLLELIAGYGAEVVGIDITTSVTVPYRRCVHLPNVTVLQADIFNPCFSPASFDFVWCEGVVVATPHPIKAFRAVSQLVKPGGRLYIWVYPSNRLSIYQRMRDLLVAPYLIPRTTLLYLCYVLAGCLFPIFRITGRRRLLRTIAFDLFDNLSPRYQWRFTEKDIQRWFSEAGFSDLRVCGRIGMSGRRVS